MTRSTKLALSLALSAVMVAPAMAQDNFPDTPANHWAYEALAKLKKDGLLVGYPDGLYRGGRPASRYELAVAIHAAYTNLKGLMDGMDTQLKALTDKAGNTTSADDVKALKDAIAALQNDVNAMKGWGDDVAALKKAADTFDKELKSLGVDVEALKKDLGDIADRVTKLEKRKPAVEISGDINLLVLAGNSRDGVAGLSVDGRTTGFKAGAGVGLTDDLNILHEGAFTIKGTNETGPKFGGTIVIGNMLGGAAGTQSLGNLSTLPGGGYSEPTGDVYLNDFSVSFDSSIGGLGFNAAVGRIGYKVSPYIFQRIDNTSYFTNARWDNGEYTFDGAKVSLNLGKVSKLDIFGGRNSSRLSTNGAEINPIIVGNNRVAGEAAVSNIDRSLGLNFTTPLTEKGNLNLSYLWLQSDTANLLATAANRLAVYGASADFQFGAVKVEGGFAKSDLKANNSNVNDSDNTAWNAKASIGNETYGLNAGYREIENNFVAPGDWGRLGILRNPGNIKGFTVGGHYNLSSTLKLSAGGEFDKGKSSSFAGSPFNTDTKINAYNVRLDYKWNPSLNTFVSYEDTKFEGVVGAGGDSKYMFTSVGFNYGLSASSFLTVQYQISHVSNEVFLAGANGESYRGGILSTQLSVKF